MAGARLSILACVQRKFMYIVGIINFIIICLIPFVCLSNPIHFWFVGLDGCSGTGICPDFNPKLKKINRMNSMKANKLLKISRNN